MLASLIRRVRPRHAVIALLVYLPFAAAMFGPWPGSVTSVARACGGVQPFDMRAGWTAADARDLVRACGTAGRAAYVRQQLLDLLYPGVLAAVLLTVTALLLRRYGTRAWPLLIPAVALTTMDYVENAGVWTLLLGWPHVVPAIATVAGAATAVKRVLGIVAYTVPLVLAGVHLGRWARVRRAAGLR